MRQFVWGLVLGIGLTWGYYEWDSIAGTSRHWFAVASSAPGADTKVDELFTRDH